MCRLNVLILRSLTFDGSLWDLGKFENSRDQKSPSMLSGRNSRDIKEISSLIFFFSLPVGPSLNIDSSVKVFCAVSPHDTIISRGLLKISFKVIIMSAAPPGRPVSVTHWSVSPWYLWMNFIGVGEDAALREDLLNASELLSFAADFTSGGLSINQRNESLLCFAVSHCTSNN